MTPTTTLKPLSFLITLCAVFVTTVSTHAQSDDPKYGETEEQRIDCQQKLSNYQLWYKNKDYDEAYSQWREACEICPEGASEGMYYFGAKLLHKEIEKASDDSLRRAVLIDSLMFIYDKRMEVFPSTRRSPNNACEVLEDKAKDYYAFFADNHAEANAMFRESVLCLGKDASASTIYQYFTSSFYYFNSFGKDSLDAEQELLKSEIQARMYTDYVQLMGYVDMNIEEAKAAGDEKKLGNFDKLAGPMEEVFAEIADCETMIPVLDGLFSTSPDDIEKLTSILRLLERVECTETNLFLPVATAVYRMNPSASAAYDIGIGYAKESRLDSSLVYFEEAIERCEECPKILTYYSKAGQAAVSLGRMSTARSYARKMLEVDPSSGEAYLLIGDAIGNGTVSNACSQSTLSSRSVFWLATDYYARAKSMNPELVERANNRIASMRKSFPTSDDLFTSGKENGETYTVPSIPGCPCSGETTTIRTR